MVSSSQEGGPGNMAEARSMSRELSMPTTASSRLSVTQVDLEGGGDRDGGRLDVDSAYLGAEDAGGTIGAPMPDAAPVTTTRLPA